MKYRDNMTPEELTQFMGEVNAIDAAYAAADKHDKKANLIDAVLAQIKCDVDSGDMTAIEELVKHLPENLLQSYLPEFDDPSDYAGMGWVGSDGRP
jgi:hypothetical protein